MSTRAWVHGRWRREQFIDVHIWWFPGISEQNVSEQNVYDIFHIVVKEYFCWCNKIPGDALISRLVPIFCNYVVWQPEIDYR